MIKKVLGWTGIALVTGLLIAVGSGNFELPPGGPPPEPGAPAAGRPTLPGGFYPYSGYYYSGYIVGVDSKNKTFDLYLGRKSTLARDVAAGIGVHQVSTDGSTVFYRRARSGPAVIEYLAFNDLKVGQLVGLAAFQGENGQIFLKINIYGEPD